MITEALNRGSEGNFLGGFLSEQHRLPVKSRIPVFISGQNSAEKETVAFRHWLEVHRPDAIIADVHELAEGLLRDMGLRVPEDVPLAILSAVPQSRRFAGIDQNDFMIGQMAIDTVVGMIYRNETGLPQTATRILVEGQWQDASPSRFLRFTSVN
ncbi:MAG: hypothetical protein WDO13_15810 [Verrucomicrobiota bacterium]